MQRREGIRRGALAGILLAVAVTIAAAVYFHGHRIGFLAPAGTIAKQERRLIDIALLLSIIVVVPVYALTIAIALKYRTGNTKPKRYRPDWDHSWLLEGIWWAIPLAIIGILSVITWHSTYQLDPYRPLASNKPALDVQVIALDWKWLFIYPAQHIASVNSLELPVGRPVNFTITSDTVMNSFWIPSLGSQIYAMPGMSTQLHLAADKAGDYAGASANISGKGFADMAFTAHAVSDADFAHWCQQASRAPQHLDLAAYAKLAKPGTSSTPHYYSNVESGLYAYTVMKYMGSSQ